MSSSEDYDEEVNSSQ